MAKEKVFTTMYDQITDLLNKKFSLEESIAQDYRNILQHKRERLSKIHELSKIENSLRDAYKRARLKRIEIK
jgi:hypothetical protein